MLERVRYTWRSQLGLALLIICWAGPIQAASPSTAARWEFTTLADETLVVHGDVRQGQPGPRPPEFDDFASDNTAIRLASSGAHVAVSDPGENSRFDFTNDDALTLEAWVQFDASQTRAPVYVVGKGRTGNPGTARDNQNWAMRLVRSEQVVQLSFLFATQPAADGSHWHRWTSTSGFSVEPGWHHIAIAYRFGDPESIRGWIDGQTTEGRWDMGGPTTEPPIVDNDEVWIGSKHGGNSFIGSIDSIAIHRGILSDAVIASRFRRTGEPVVVRPMPEEMPEFSALPAGRVLTTLAEGLPSAERWPMNNEGWPAESVRWLGDEFLLPRIPQRYDDWGIRDSWRAPLLLRMAADVPLAPGKYRFLLRARGLGRLWVNGQLVAQTQPVDRESPNGEQPISPVPQPPLPGMRAHGYHQQEIVGEAQIDASSAVEGNTGAAATTTRVVLELAVGGKGQRTETGEICVAVQTLDRRPSGSTAPRFEVLRACPDSALPLTNAAVEPALARIEASLSAYDDATRREKAASHDDFWQRRHQAAHDWANKHLQPHLAPSPGGSAAEPHPIDALIASKMNKAAEAAAATEPGLAEQFHSQVLPILSENCFRCHGEKQKGGLKLNSRDAALLGGESEVPAVVPGDPESSELLAQIRSGAMPPTETGLSSEQIAILERWIGDGAPWPAPPVAAEQLAPAPLLADEAFLRRIYLDIVGVPPTSGEARKFLQDSHPHKRQRLIDHLLQDPRLADHWVSYWQDLLAENPTLLNQSLNSTGPFRWFLYESLRDHKPLDRMITDLIMMRGSSDTGGSAGFALAAENDAPFAAKGHILAAAFLGVELQCARCHDSPFHSTLQRDLYSLAAMLERKSVTVPATSRVPQAFFDQKGRESLIQVTLKPDESIAAQWPFADVTGIADNPQLDPLLQDPSDTRERLAALLTAPNNLRFGRVMVNRVWQRLIGAGLVEPVDDWEGQVPSHPQLLDWLVYELLTHDYDLRHLIRQIVTSQVYMRQAHSRNLGVAAEQRFFNAPVPRRLTAEQIVDSLHVATGQSIDSEELTFVHDGQRPLSSRQTLGIPRRAWMFASLNNERDRPSLSLPRARTITDVLQAFGWNGARQEPVSQRDGEPNVLQPGILANGLLTTKLTRAAYRSEMAQLAVDADSPAWLVDEWFLRVLCRRATPAERATFEPALADGFEARLSDSPQAAPAPPEPLPQITWFNHLRPKANTIQQELERRAQQGPPPDPRLDPAWRAVYEDFVWSLINHREFVWLP